MDSDRALYVEALNTYYYQGIITTFMWKLIHEYYLSKEGKVKHFNQFRSMTISFSSQIVNFITQKYNAEYNVYIVTLKDKFIKAY